MKHILTLTHMVLVLLFPAAAYCDFSLVCPPDITISCTDDYTHDLNVYGKAYSDHNGNIQYLHDCKTVIDINDCGVGTIKRTWGVENPENWQWLTCTQVITVSNKNAFGYRDIQWPLSLEIRSCNPWEDVKHLSAPYDAPSWLKPKCAKPMTSYKDTKFRVNDGCEKIVREWKILDWCQYDPVLYPGRGVFTAVQVIKLIAVDSAASLLCKKEEVYVNDHNCDSIYLQLEPAKFSSSCPIYNRVSNNSPYAVDKGADASGYYPNGVTEFYYTAEYGCGTEIKCKTKIEVKNGIKPTPYCLTGIVLTLMPADTDNDGNIDDGMIEVWASDLNKASWHHCPKQSLSFSFSSDPTDRSRVFTCKDVGEQEVEIWVTDSLGNQDLCKTKIIIQNNNPNIPNCDGNLHGGNKGLKGINSKVTPDGTQEIGNVASNNKIISTTAKSNPLHAQLSSQFSDEYVLNIPMSGNYSFDLITTDGKLLFSQKKYFEQGKNGITIPATIRGFLIVRLQGPTTTWTNYICLFR